MKYKAILLLLFLSLMPLLRADQEDFALHAETLSVETIKRSSKYHHLDMSDAGHHKTILRLTHLPRSSSYILRCQRPLAPMKGKTQKLKREILLGNGELFGEGEALIISSRGFLPGEKVILSLETEEGNLLRKISFIPHPLIFEMKDGTSKIKGELICISPTRYEFFFEGIPSNETLKMLSFSSGEFLDYDFCYKQGSCLAYMPGVIGQEGGLSRLTIKKTNGDRFILNLPWGKELLRHLDGDKEPLVVRFSPLLDEIENVK